MDNNASWVAQVWFKNFFFSYEEEYLICDWTCLIAEFGGNLGFFLGGSLLALIDLVLRPIKAKMLKEDLYME